MDFVLNIAFRVAALAAFTSWIITSYFAGGQFLFFFLWIATFIASPAIFAFVFASYAYIKTSGRSVDWSKHLDVKDQQINTEYANQPIPMELAHEAYLAEKLDFKKDLLETLRKEKESIFRWSFTRGNLEFFFKKFISQTVFHTQSQDSDDIVPVYDRGNDFYGYFLGETMIYTSAVFNTPTETLEQAQYNKLDLICKKTMLKPGDRHLDLGCGWGTLLWYAAKNFKTDSYGITLAKHQKEFGLAAAKREGVEKNVNVWCIDYRDIAPAEKFNKITCLEMSEHVGVVKYHRFMKQVYNMLEEDGIFYLQIAGLRRSWQLEDLVWGLYMAKYIFPGADASCPLGFAVDELEAAGFEIRSVENVGIHYSMTIEKWYNNWVQNKSKVVASFGERYYRMFALFLAWSVCIAAQGSSTCWQIVAYKNKNSFDRMRFIGHRP